MKPFMNGQTETIARINVTPIIDVAMVLVITLLITAPMISLSKVDVDLPQALTRSVEDEVRVSITVGKDGAVAVDENTVPPDGLVPALRERLAAPQSGNVLVVIRADAALPYSAVREILKEVRSAGASRIAIATRQRGRGDL
jgi:biopolymer transport protein TolR